jgi:hypothetical protein
MLNTTMASGVGLAISQLHTLDSLIPSSLDSAESDEEFPPLPSPGPVHVQLAPIWTTSSSLNSYTRESLRIIPVIGDGSCAGGAVTTVIVNTHLISPSVTHPHAPPAERLVPLRECNRTETDLFRTTQLPEYIRGWTAEEWERHVPEGGELAAMMLDDARCRNKCQTSCSGCDITNAKDAFLYVCAHPTRWCTPVFFYLAAAFLQTGILLLVHDHRQARSTTSQRYQMHDFGTLEYAQSMILYGKLNTLGKKSLLSSGHYTTVCLQPNASVPEGQLLFRRSSAILMSLRVIAQHRTSEATVPHQRVYYQAYPMVAQDVGRILSPDSPPLLPAAAVAGAAAQTIVDEISGLGSPVGTSDRHGLRPPHARRPPQKFADQKDDVVKVVSARRSLSKPLAAAAVLGQLGQNGGEVVPGPAQLPPPSAPPAHKAGKRRGKKGTDNSNIDDASTSPVAAAPALPMLDCAGIIGDDVMADVRRWVRKTTSRGRLASQVHFSDIPLWTTHFRTVLQSLVRSLKAQPMNEKQVVGHLCLLWSLPGHVFTRPSKSRGGQGRRKRSYGFVHARLNDTEIVHKLLSSLLGRTSSPSLSSDTCPSPSDADSLVSEMSNSCSLLLSDVCGANYVSENDDDDDGECSAAEARSTKTVPTSESESARDAKAARRAQQLFYQGYSRRALQSLHSTHELVDLSDQQEREIMREMHPRGDTSLPQPPNAPQPIVVDLGWMKDELLASNTGAAAGPSGLGSNFLSVLATDAHCVEGLAFVIQQIVNNSLPPVARTLISTSYLVSLSKGEQKRRPIAISDILYRMAARYAVMRVKVRAQQRVAPFQLGIGQPDGCTQIVHTVQQLLLNGPLPPPPFSPVPPSSTSPVVVPVSPRPLACLSLDIANAFNTIDRAALLTAVYSDPEMEACWRIVHFAYGQPSLLLMRCGDGVIDREAFIESKRGVKQGDPLAAMLFSLAMHAVYKAIAAQVSGACLAFIDDAHPVGTLEECWKVWESIPALLAPLGLTLNQAKCELTCFHMEQVQNEADMAALQSFSQHTPLKINDKTLRLLGCVVGASGECVVEALRDDAFFQVEQVTAFRRVPRLPYQLGIVALHRMTGSVLENRLRAMPPEWTAQHAQAYDERLYRIADDMIGLTAADNDQDLPAIALELRQSLSRGGGGLISAVDIAPAAFLAGIENTLRRSSVFRSIWDESVPLSSAPHSHAVITAALQRISEREASLSALSSPADVATVSTSSLPLSTDSFVQHYRRFSSPPIQPLVTQRIQTLIQIAKVTKAGQLPAGRREQELARLTALTAPESSLWLRTVPTSTRLRLSNDKWRCAMRLRLGMYVRSVSDRCDVCKRQLPSKDFSYHAMHCIPLSGASITDRHNAVLHTIAHYARLMLLSPRVEPAQLCHDSAKRPDIQLDLPVRTLLGDVSVIHPLAPSNYKKANSRVVERIGDDAEAIKNGKYKELVESQDIRFSPLIFYSTGGFHRSALSFIRVMTAALDEQACLLSRAEWKKQLLEHIAIAVQRGNADIMIRNDQRGRARTDWWIMGGDTTHRRRRRRLNPPLYSVSDVPWIRSGGDGHSNKRGDARSQPLCEGTSPSMIVIPNSLPSHISASPSPSSSGSVASFTSSPDREGNHRCNELTDMQVDDASESAVEWDDSGVSGTYVRGCSATPVLAETVSGVSGSSSSSCDSSDRRHNGTMLPAMEQEAMECDGEEWRWREAGRDVVFNPHMDSWSGSRGGGGVGVGGGEPRQTQLMIVSGGEVPVETAVAAGDESRELTGSGWTVMRLQGDVAAADNGGVGDDDGVVDAESIV